MDVRTIAVLGAGAMGKGITYAVLTGGFRAILTDVQEGLLAEARIFVHETLISAKDRGKWFGDPDHAMEALTTTQSFDDLAEADLVIEAVPEDIKLKLDLFGRLDSLVRPEAILATNTSSLSVTEMSAATKHPKRFLGLHFFQPTAHGCCHSPRFADQTSLKILSAASSKRTNRTCCNEVSSFNCSATSPSIISAHSFIENPAMPVPTAGKAMVANPFSFARSSELRVETRRDSAVVSPPKPMLAAWMTNFALRLPPPVMAASPMGIEPVALHSC